MAHQGNPNYGGNQQAGFVVNPQQHPPGPGGIYPSTGPGFPELYNPNQQPHLSNPGFQPPPAVGHNVNWCGTVPSAQLVNPYPVQGHPEPVYFNPSAPSFNPSLTGPITPQQIPHEASYPIQQGAVQDHKHHTGKDKKKDEKKNKRRVFVQLVQNEFECDDSDAEGVEYTPASLANKPKKDKKDKKDKDKKDKDKKDKDKTKKKNIYRMKKVAIVQNPSELQFLGQFSDLPMQDQMHKNIEQYVNNSVDMKDSKGGGGVRIHKIYQVSGGGGGGGMPTASGGLGWNSGPVTMPMPGGAAGAPPVHGASTLLWYKTTRESAQRLQMGGAAVPFYDRLARALPVRPKELGQPLRQLVLLCSVSLGTEYKASEGSNSKSWRTGATQFPQGHDSVLIPGRCVPDWGDKWDKVQDPNLPRIPYGKTRKSGDKKKEKSDKIKISGDYNVFLIQDVRRAQVKYAVDVEIIPGSEDKDKSKSK